MSLFNMTEINLLKKSVKMLTEERDSWKKACIDIVIYQQYGEEKISRKRYKEIFKMCYDATSINDEEKGGRSK